MSAPEIPTIDEMQANYDQFCAAVDREDTLGASVYAAVCAAHIEKLLKAKPLFTAAPELLEALKAVLSDPDSTKVVQMAETAIAKAEGK